MFQDAENPFQELTDGWSGRIIATQRYFSMSYPSVVHYRFRFLTEFIDWLDGGMITLAFFTINFFHPGMLVGPGPWKSLRSSSSDSEFEKSEPA